MAHLIYLLIYILTLAAVHAYIYNFNCPFLCAFISFSLSRFCCMWDENLLNSHSDWNALGVV